MYAFRRSGGSCFSARLVFAIRREFTNRASRVLAIALLVALTSPIAVLAQATGTKGGQPLSTQAPTTPTAPPPATPNNEADRLRFDTLRKDGFDALYNLDYDGARKRFKELSTSFPDHPAGPQFLAATLWAQTLNESRRLQASLYNSSSFFNASEDKPDPKVVAQFRELTREATLRAKARLARDKNDIEALYFLGATEGLKAAFATGVERRFMGALSDGSNSIDRHHDVLKRDPSYHDAELTIGLYDYIVGTLPTMVKMMAAIAGVRGSKKRGLLTLERVAAEGRWARDDAKSLLIVLYKREGRYGDALAFSRELGEKYPRNYLYKLESADALVSQASEMRTANKMTEASAAEREAFSIFDALLQRERGNREGAKRSLDLIHYRYGEALMIAREPERAAKEFLAAATVQGAEQNLATMSRLRAAQALDLAGKRNDALEQYRVVLGRPDVYETHDAAKRGLREPYKPKADGKRTSE